WGLANGQLSRVIKAEPSRTRLASWTASAGEGMAGYSLTIEARRGGGPVWNAELPVIVLEVLRHCGGGEPELERDLVVLLPERNMLEDLPLAHRELFDPRVALVEHEHVQAAGLRDPNVEPAISMR